MKDIILPSETSDAIDLGAIDDNTGGIVISYKGNDAVGYIAYTCGEAVPWAWKPVPVSVPPKARPDGFPGGNACRETPGRGRTRPWPGGSGS